MKIATTSTARNKAKGRRLQKWVRDLLLNNFPELDRGGPFQEGDIRSQTMGVNGEDVPLSPNARKYLPLQIECKNRKHFAVYQDYRQARSHGPWQPVLIYKEDHQQPLAIIDAAWFAWLLRSAHEYRGRLVPAKGEGSEKLPDLQVESTSEEES